MESIYTGLKIFRPSSTTATSKCFKYTQTHTFHRTSFLQPLKHFLVNWQEIIAEPTILGYVEAYRIPLLETFQNFLPTSVRMTEEEELIVWKKLWDMLKKKAIIPLQNKPKHSLGSMFIVPKKSDEFQPVINLRKQNSCAKYNLKVLIFHYFFTRNLKTM